MFVSNPLGNPAFHTTRPSGVQRSEEVAKPKPPEKPIIPYLRYSKKVWESVKLANPESKLWEVGKIIGTLWRELPDAEKQVFYEEYEVDKLAYQEQLRLHHASTSYQNWLSSKSRVEETVHDLRGDNRISIQPDEDEDPDEQFTSKHVSAARYHRNHILMANILSDVCMPDERSHATPERLNTLREHVQSLTKNLDKLTGELTEMDSKHDLRKRRFLSDSIAFEEKYKKVCQEKPNVTESQFEEMVEKFRTDFEQQRAAAAMKQRADAEARRAEQAEAAPPTAVPNVEGGEDKHESVSAPAEPPSPVPIQQAAANLEPPTEAPQAADDSVVVGEDSMMGDDDECSDDDDDQ